jgi:hypothetical protein
MWRTLGIYLNCYPPQQGPQLLEAAMAMAMVDEIDWRIWPGEEPTVSDNGQSIGASGGVVMMTRKSSEEEDDEVESILGKVLVCLRMLPLK